MTLSTQAEPPLRFQMEPADDEPLLNRIHNTRDTPHTRCGPPGRDDSPGTDCQRRSKRAPAAPSTPRAPAMRAPHRAQRPSRLSDTNAYFHHGGVSVRKSVSVHGESTALPSTSLRCASASGAGPRMTLPVGSYCEPWHGHMYLFAARFHGTTQPRWVQTALIA